MVLILGIRKESYENDRNFKKFFLDIMQVLVD